jgi:hypothetical protein
MENFLSNANTPTRLKSPDFNFTPYYNFGVLMRNQLSGSYQTYNPTTQNTNPLYYHWKQSAASTSTLLTGHFIASTSTIVPVPDESACTFSLSFADPGSISGQNLLSSTYSLSNFTLAPGPMINLATYDFSVTVVKVCEDPLARATSALIVKL